MGAEAGHMARPPAALGPLCHGLGQPVLPSGGSVACMLSPQCRHPPMVLCGARLQHSPPLSLLTTPGSGPFISRDPCVTQGLRPGPALPVGSVLFNAPVTFQHVCAGARAAPCPGGGAQGQCWRSARGPCVPASPQPSSSPCPSPTGRRPQASWPPWPGCGAMSQPGLACPACPAGWPSLAGREDRQPHPSPG